MRMPFLFLLPGLLPIVITACGGSPGGPGPTPSPAPTPTPYPNGVPHATAFENLDHVRRLEAATGRQSLLVNVGAFGILSTGVPVAGGGAWFYLFSDTKDQRLYSWQVYGDDGQVLMQSNVPDIPPRLDRLELFPLTILDSPRAWDLAVKFGAQPYLDRYPNAHSKMDCRYRAGLPTWEIEFFDNSVTPPPCRLGPIYIDARNGELLSADLYCLTRLP